MLSGCGSVPEVSEPVPVSEETTESVEKEEEVVTEDKAEDDTENPVQPSEEEDYWKGPDENKWDGGPDFTSIATQFSGIFHDLTIEEAAQKYAINLVDGGKYAGYKGDIGEIIPECKDIDHDGDRKSDVIRRVGSHYVIECSSAGGL